MNDYYNKEDDDIVKGIIDNQEQAYEQFVKKYYKLIIYICNKYCENIQDADEIGNDILLKLFEKIHLYDKNKARLSAWVNKVALNYILDWISENKKREEDSIESIQDNKFLICEPARIDYYGFTKEEKNNNDDGSNEDDEALVLLRRAMKKLSERDRQILQYRADGFDYYEISGFLNLNYKTVTTAYSRAVNKIRAEFAGKEFLAINKKEKG